MNLYSCRSVPEGYRITKHDLAFEPMQEGDRWCSYIVTNLTCTCPAGKRPSCKHRKMLGKFFERKHVDDGWFYNDANGMWHRNAAFVEPDAEILAVAPEPAPDPAPRSASGVPVGFIRRV